MSGNRRGVWIRYAITTLIGLGWSAFDRWAQLQPFFEAWLPWVSPLAYVAVGAAIGFMACKTLNGKKLSAKEEEIAAPKDELSSLDAEATEQKVDPLETEAFEAFRAICSTCYYDESFIMVEPVVFSLDDEKLQAIGLSERAVRLAEECGLVRIEGKSGWLSVDSVFKGGHPGLSFAPDPTHDNERGIRMNFKGFSKLVRPHIFEKELPSGKRDLKEFVRLGIVRFTVKGRETAKGIEAEVNDALHGYIEAGMK